jgi:hypothetical protein
MRKEKMINWIIDTNLWDEYEDRLVESIKKSGANVYFYDEIKNSSFKKFILKNFQSNNDVNIFHGSLGHGRQLTHLPIYPGVFLNIDNYECYNYYGYFGDYLLNEDYMMMALNDVLRNKEKIFNNFINTSIFIRPSNGYKSFPGQMLSNHNFDSEFNLLIHSYCGLDMNTLVLIADKQLLKEEYRFIVVDGEVISGSQYFDEKNINTFNPYYDRICQDQNATDFAIEMSKIYQPDLAYTIDVCKTNNDEYKLLELNSFNCASMYGNDYEKVVNAINKLAVNEHNSLFKN